VPSRRSPSSAAFRGGRAAKARQRLLRTLPAVCPLCGLTIFTAAEAEVDHVVPVALGGAPYAASNQQLTHTHCNREKGANGHRNGTTTTPKPTRTPLGALRWSICWFENETCGTPACRCNGRCWPTCDDGCAGRTYCSRSNTRHAA
jgi:hypothetical protein